MLSTMYIRALHCELLPLLSVISINIKFGPTLSHVNTVWSPPRLSSKSTEAIPQGSFGTNPVEKISSGVTVTKPALSSGKLKPCWQDVFPIGGPEESSTVTIAVQLSALDPASTTVSTTSLSPTFEQSKNVCEASTFTIWQLSTLPPLMDWGSMRYSPDSSNWTVIFWQIAVGAIVSIINTSA